MFTWLSTFPEASYLCNLYGGYYLGIIYASHAYPSRNLGEKLT